jgi:predicted dehydrogenase
MGSGHARVIVEAKSADFHLAAVADTDGARAEAVGSQHGVPWFDSGEKLIESGLTDAVIIATPHYFHPPLTIRAARAGLHVLTEKPVAVSVGPARAMVAECRKRRVALGVMFQQRNRPNMRKLKEMVASGQIGEVFRVQMICSVWYRTQAYYDSGAWRGTWAGEGGGILLNQAPHSLDLFQWIAGMPRRVLATVAARHHKIEVENTANAILDYGDGRTGYIYATTAEAPGMEQLLVAGDKGTLLAEGNGLRWGKLPLSLKKHLRTAKEGFASPGCTWQDVPLPRTEGSHINVTRAFVACILRGREMLATGAEGINELELSNAIYISAYRRKPVDLPTDAGEMERLLTQLHRKCGTGKSENFRRQADADLKDLLGKFPA